MENKMVTIRSSVNATVVLDSPTNNLHRVWSRAGAIQRVPFDVLEIIVYEPGVEYLFKTGILYIDDENIKGALGWNDDPEMPKIVYVDAAKAKEYLALPEEDFTKTLKSLTNEQRKIVAETAIAEKYNDLKKARILTEMTGIEVTKAIDLAVQEQRAAELKAKSASK